MKQQRKQFRIRGGKKTQKNCGRKKFALKEEAVKISPFRNLKTVKRKEAMLKKGQSIGFTGISSLKSMGRIQRSNGCFLIGDKYKNILVEPKK